MSQVLPDLPITISSQLTALWIAVNLLNSVSGKNTPHIDLSKV